MTGPPTDRFEKFIKSRWTWIVVALVITLGIGSTIGRTSAKVPIEDKKVSYDELVEKLEKKEKELSSINDEITTRKKERSQLIEDQAKLKTEIKTQQIEFDEALEIIKNKETVLAEIKSSETTLSSKQSELEEIENTITTRKDELAKVEQLIVEKEEEPLELSAGQFFVGSDIPAGRYKITPVGRGSNFQTYDKDGRIDVNIILSNRDDFGLKEYITYLFDGYIIDTQTPARYQPVE
ncbi:hypothetical protein QT711_11530 [Sporosarcina saromensis]|uniref:Uncharacterized protein n=1 Tax=Sporosarcina saromensis TaxID=359365 RepID=A0ABU4GA14_9BACL|nr:hypothetical protein [Sporosarcina saromensis]MDW0113819.1 hypothetical protein [Sporosarcina saromensis]